MKDDKQALSIISLIMGIIGFWFAGLIFGGLALLLGALSWEKMLGKIGFVIGAIDVIGVLIFIL